VDITQSYLPVAFIIAVSNSRLHICKTGSSEQIFSCSLAVMNGNDIAGKAPFTVRILSTRTNNRRTGTLT
jgi:hypothetical protein